MLHSTIVLSRIVGAVSPSHRLAQASALPESALSACPTSGAIKPVDFMALSALAKVGFMKIPRSISRGLAVIGLCVSTAAFGQQHHGHGPAAQHRQHGASAPYAGMQQREIKALSNEQIADLRAGRGMSLALPAELNGYPGPAHALELAEALGLSAQQRARTQALFEQMQSQAKARGEEVLAAERALDQLFKDQRATPEALAGATTQAALAQGRLRESHLRYHLAMRDLLSAEQVAQYNKLRGY